MAGARRSQRDEIGAKRAFVGRAICPKSAAGLPIHPQALVMRHSILHDERFHPLRVRQDHPKAYGTAVVLHVKRVARQAKRLGKAIHDFSTVIEGVRERLRVWPVAVSVAWIVGSNKMIAIGKPGEK